MSPEEEEEDEDEGERTRRVKREWEGEKKKVNGSSVKLRLKKEKIFVLEESTRENCGVIIWRSRTRSERDEACCGVSLGKEE